MVCPSSVKSAISSSSSGATSRGGCMGGRGTGFAGPTVTLGRIFLLVIRARLDRGQRGIRGQPINQRAHRHRHDLVRPRFAGALLAATAIPVLRAHVRFVKKSGQRVDIRVRLEDHVASFPSIATIGAALRHESLAAKTARAIATVAGLGVNSNVVNEHGGGESKDEKSKIESRCVQAGQEGFVE